MMPRSSLPLLMLLAIGCAKDADQALPTPTLLSAVGANHLLPAYSPDGSRVAVWQRNGAEFQLWLADGDLGNLTPQSVKSVASIGMLWSPDGTWLATTETGATSTSIVLVAAAGGEVTPVYSAPNLTFPLSWSADGAKLLVLTTRAGGSITTLVVDVATKTAQPLLPGEERAHLAVFAPVGQHAAVMLYDSARTTIWALDSLGAAPRQLTRDGYEAPAAGMPWSPDGTQLVYESRQTGEPDLWVLDFATGTSRQLTNDLRADRSPYWSPDGEWILFESERGRQTDLWVIPAVGGEAIRLTNDPEVEFAFGWRGQSRQVVYTIEGGTGSVQTVPVAGGEERQLTADSVKVDYFNLSPDGSQVVFTSRRGGSLLDIWVMPSGGGEARLVGSPQSDERRVYWSPDGTRLAFTGLAGGTADPWVMDVATGAVQQVLAWDSWEITSIWGRDGNELYVLSDRDSRFIDAWRVPLDGGEPVRLTTDGRLSSGILGVLDGGSRLIVSQLGNNAAGIGPAEVRADGTSRTIPTTKTVWGMAWHTPLGRDSIAVQVSGDSGRISSVMMALSDGGSRPIGPPGTIVSTWSHAGTFLTYYASTSAGSAVGIVDPTSGTVRTLTPGTALDIGAEFLPGDSVLVFRRNRPESRVATLDLANLLSRTP